MLTAEGVVKVQQSQWDEENLCATSNLDIELDAIELESTNKSWLPVLQDDVLEFNTSQIEMQNRLWAPLIKGGHKPPTVHCHSVY